jgi:hypothetical protein
MKYKAMSSSNAVKMINSLVMQYYPLVKYFESVDNIIPNEYIESVFPFLNIPSDVRLFYEVKADLKADQLAVLAAHNVLELQPGIESLSTYTLKLMKKGTTSFSNLKFLQNAASNNINLYWNLLIGFPGEASSTYEKYLVDLPKLFHLPPPSGVFPVRFDRYSPYFVKQNEYGLILSPYDYYFLVYPYEEKTMSSLAYHFVDKNYGADYIRDAAKWLKRLTNIVDLWKSRYADDSRTPELSLCLEGGHWHVHDSRKISNSVNYNLTDIQGKILSVLQTKGNKAYVSSELGLAIEIVEENIGTLGELDLLFDENGTYMSLIQLDFQTQSV